MLAAGLILAPPFWLLPVALGGLVLLVAYTIVIAAALLRGRPATCACFGSATDDRVSAWTLVRNLLLVAMSGVTVAAGASGASVAGAAWSGTLDWWWAVACLFVSALTATILHRGSTARNEPSIDHESLGDYLPQPIPEMMVATLLDDAVSIRDLASAKPRLLLFLSLGCPPCREILAELDSFVGPVPMLEVHPVFDCHRDELPDSLLLLRGRGWYDETGAVQRALRVERTPAAIVLGANGEISGGPVYGAADIHDFVSDIRRQLAAV